ncbi:MAG: hypothetical protein WKF67_15025 [Rubrobacteraceae bacterium]
MEIFVEYERDGFAETGARNDQPSLYLHALDCVRTARTHAEQLERQEEAHEAFLKEQEAEGAADGDNVDISEF